MQRKLAAILAADVVGYSRLMRTNEVRTLTVMKSLWNEVVQPSVRAHRGRVFKLMGDGMLAEFASVVDAANAAEAIQTAANARAEAQPEDLRIQLRIGINLGDVVVDGSDLYGDGVNIAARLQEVAPTGGIAVSATTHEHLRGKTAITFADAGERSLKNIDQPVRVWLWPDAGGLPEMFAAAPSGSSQPSIAVLPFQNLSSAPDAEFFADGMTEDVIDDLFKFRWLVVIARGTMFTYKGKSVTDAQVAEDLNVRYVLEGSVRHAGQRMRLSAQLTDSQTGGSIWSQRFDRQVDDVFAIQDEITNAIAAAIAPEIDRAERSRARRRQRADVDAWLLYQQGLSAYYRLSEEGLDEAIAAFQKAQEADPQFASAFAMEAVAHARIALNFRLGQPAKPIESVGEIAAKAVALDPRDPLCLWASGRVYTAMLDFEKGVAPLERAVALNPNFATAWFGLANILWRVGALDRAHKAIEKAISLSPFDPFMPVFLYNRGIILLLREDYANSAKACEQAMEAGLVPPWAHATRIAAYWKIGKTQAAAASVSDLLKQNPNFRVSTIRDAFGTEDSPWPRLCMTALRELGVPEE